MVFDHPPPVMYPFILLSFYVWSLFLGRGLIILIFNHFMVFFLVLHNRGKRMNQYEMTWSCYTSSILLELLTYKYSSFNNSFIIRIIESTFREPEQDSNMATEFNEVGGDGEHIVLGDTSSSYMYMIHICGVWNAICHG